MESDRFMILWHYKRNHHYLEGTGIISNSNKMQEPGRYYTFESRLPQGVFFEIRPNNLPRNAKPITDETSGMCIGYSVAQAPGLWQIYDVQGHFVRLEEAPLETPLIDPRISPCLPWVFFASFGPGECCLNQGHALLFQ